MRGFLAGPEPRFDLMSGHGAVAGVVISSRVRDALDDGTADLHGDIAVLALHAISAVVTGTALDDFHLRPRHQRQHIARAESEILDPQMARHVVTDLADRARKIRAQS